VLPVVVMYPCPNRQHGRESSVEQTTITAGGRKLTMRGTVPIYLEWHQNWGADHSAIYATAKDLPSGSTVIDVGANIGMMTCSLAVQRPELKIIAIEPVPDNVECLRRNVTDNGITNVEIIHAAASDKPGTVRVNINGPWSAVLEHGEVSVPAVSLDQFADKNVSYVKIDVEGWEPYVLAGGRKLLAKLRPQVFMEWNTWSLLLAHHDPISFAREVWKAFDVTEAYFSEKPQGAPKSDIDIVCDNITKHGSVSDLLMRPRQGVVMPTLKDMIHSPNHLRLLDLYTLLPN
jgi:FkbM family methyltransferase